VNYIGKGVTAMGDFTAYVSAVYVRKKGSWKQLLWQATFDPKASFR
jgi:hypothetical protein